MQFVLYASRSRVRDCSEACVQLCSACEHWDTLNLESHIKQLERSVCKLFIWSPCGSCAAQLSQAEIQTGWWVRNGQSMHQQQAMLQPKTKEPRDAKGQIFWQAEYRRKLRQWDLMTVQASFSRAKRLNQTKIFLCIFQRQHKT